MSPKIVFLSVLNFGTYSQFCPEYYLESDGGIEIHGWKKLKRLILT